MFHVKRDAPSPSGHLSVRCHLPPVRYHLWRDDAGKLPEPQQTVLWKQMANANDHVY